MTSIAFASSFSSQIGLLSFLKVNYPIINYLIVIPSNEHKNNKYIQSIFHNNDQIKNIVIVRSWYLKLFIICWVDILKVLSKLNLLKIALIVPRPFWLFSILGQVSFVNHLSDLFSHYDNKNFLNYYYGDGLSCFCYESKPFWLKDDRNFLTPSRIENKYSRYYYFYHMYDADEVFEKKCLENEINVLRLDAITVHASIDIALNILESKFPFSDFITTGLCDVLLTERKLSILTTTTFSKTNRCSFDEEVDLYINYFNRNIPEDDSFILFKLHPAAGEKMNRTIFKIVVDKFGDRVLFVNSFVNAIPIEIILKYLIKNGIFLEKNITLHASSSGTAMPKSLFPNIQLVIAFGRLFLRNILNDSYLEKRLRQEEILVSKFLR